MQHRQNARSYVFAGLLSLFATSAHAIPTLQLYADNATYNPTTESWALTASGGPVTIYTIGNIAGSGGKGTIYDAELIISFDAPGPATAPSLTATSGGFSVAGNAFQDSSTPIAPIAGPIESGDITLLSPQDGTVVNSNGLNTHQDAAIGGADRVWVRYQLGDFDTADSQLADFNGSPAAPGGIVSYDANLVAQINAYTFAPGSLDGWHFDLIGWLDTDNDGLGDQQADLGDKLKIAPYSHDLDGSVGVPEPSSLGLLAGALFLFGRRRQGRS